MPIQMYQSIHVRNFRGLKDLEVPDLRRVNLFVGPNNVGKTTLLEAIWLLHTPGNPVLSRNLAVFRGVRRGGPLSPELEWEPLFHNFTPSNEVEISAERDDGTRESLRIVLLPSKQWSEETIAGQNGADGPFEGTVGRTTAFIPETLSFRYSSNGQNEVISEVKSLAGGEASLEFNPEIQHQAVFLSGRSGGTQEELASRFTEIVDANQIQFVVDALRILQPGLESLSLGFTLPERQLFVRAHIQGLPRPVPIGLLGEGAGRLLEILLAIPDVTDGSLLVDEFERGLYYKNQESVWRAVARASVEANAQVFATTHSLECVQAAVEAFRCQEELFRLYRIERNDGKTRVVEYDQETAEAAIGLGLEFR